MRTATSPSAPPLSPDLGHAPVGDAAKDEPVTVSHTQTRTDQFPDLSALTIPTDQAAVAQVKAASNEFARRDLASAQRGAVLSTITYGVVAVGVTGTLAGLPIMIGVDVWPSWASAICFLVALVPIGALGATLGRWAWRKISREWRLVPGWTHRWRMSQVAAANSLSYSPTGLQSPVGTVLANAGGPLWDVFVERSSTRRAWFGNSRPRRDNSARSAPSGWSFIVLSLPATVPHLMLTPRLTGLQIPPFLFAGNQRKSLEGDFDRHFTLWAPTDYAADALYVVTPDLMARLIDHLPGSYVEAYDRTLVITAPRPFDFDRPETWHHISNVMEGVLPKAHRQTRNYRDPRSDVSGEVAPNGRRLRFGVSIGLVIFIAWVLFNIVRIVMTIH